MEDEMKRVVLAGALLLAASPVASAQSTTIVTTPGPTAGPSIVIAPEQRTHIRTYVTERHVRPVTVEERVAVGAVLPADVELVAVPDDWGPDLRRYRYVYTNDHVVLVEPSSRRIVQIVE
jgi:hypothetical protein